MARKKKQKIYEIPDEFQLIGRTIKVEYDPDLVKVEKRQKDGKTQTRRVGKYGKADYKGNKIILWPELSNENLYFVFIHELVHWIIYLTYEKSAEDLRNSERFVSKFSEILFQYIKQEKNDS